MVLCDHVWTDPSTGKRTLIGTYSTLAAQTFPATHVELAVYACLTEGHGKSPIRLRISDVDDARPPVFEAHEELGFPHPRAIQEIVFSIRNLAFTQPGDYRVQLFVHDEFIIERSLAVTKAMN
jgi:hypothetical protein